MRSPPLKVGDLARATGLSVRTLHYYDEIGLLSPSHRTRSGHRLYTEGDIARLQQIMSLRQLGLRLDEIQGCLESRAFSPLKVVEQHLARVREQITLEQELCRRLEAIAAILRSGEVASPEQFLKTIEVMTMYEKYYTPEQLAELKQRGDAMGEEKMREAQDAWKQLFAEAKIEMDKGTDPKSEVVQKLRARMDALIHAFTGGNPAIEASLNKMHRQEPDLLSRNGFDPALAEYMGKARA
jgi:DNA-binding transcriptional MerR regulator